MTLPNTNTISDSSKNNLKLNKNSSSIIGEDINKLSNSSNNISQSLNKTNSNNYNETVNKAYFSTDNLTLVTTQVGSMVELPCTVHHIGDGMVRENLKILFENILPTRDDSTSCSKKDHLFNLICSSRDNNH